MNDLQIFKNEEFGEIRTVTIDNKPWFVGKDVAGILGYSNTRDALSKHVDEEDRIDGVAICDSIGREQTPVLINESGLYSLILSSKLPSAKRFKHWVTSEVLPAIHKIGGYQMQAPQGKELLALAVLEAQKTIEEQTVQIERMKPKEIFADAVSASDSSILVRDMAKILKQNGINIGEKRLYKWLRDKGYLIKKEGKDHNSPTQRSMDMKLFEVAETVIQIPGKDTIVKKTSRITGKGQQYFLNKFMENGVYQ